MDFVWRGNGALNGPKLREYTSKDLSDDLWKVFRNANIDAYPLKSTAGCRDILLGPSKLDKITTCTVETR